MKRLSIYGLALVASLALTVTAGAATASARTVLCKANENPCAAGNVAPAGSWLTYGILNEGSKVTIKGAGVNLSCPTFIIGMRTTEEVSEPGSPLHGVEEGAFIGCQNEGVGCSSSSINNVPAAVERVSSTAIEGIGTEAEPFRLTVSCKFNNQALTCVYTPAGSVGAFAYSLILFINEKHYFEEAVEKGQEFKAVESPAGCGSKVTLAAELVSGANYPSTI